MPERAPSSAAGAHAGTSARSDAGAAPRSARRDAPSARRGGSGAGGHAAATAVDRAATSPTPTPHCADAAHSDQVAGDEPLLPARVHRPSDLMRLLIGVARASPCCSRSPRSPTAPPPASNRTSARAPEQAPDLLIKIAGLVSSIAVLLVPVAFAIERLIKRDGLRIADGVLAAVLAHGVTLATDLWVARAAPDSIQDALTQPSPGDPRPHRPGARLSRARHRLHDRRRHGPHGRAGGSVLWVVLLLDAFAMLVGGYTTPFSIILTVLIGWTVAYGTLYAVGSPNVRPTGQHPDGRPAPRSASAR